MLVAWLICAQTILLSSCTILLDKTQVHLVRREAKEIGSERVHRLDEAADGVQTSLAKSRRGNASRFFRSCPRDEVEFGGDMPEEMSQEQYEKVATAAQSIELSHLGHGPHLKIGCAFKMAHKERQLMLDTVQTWAKKCDGIFVFSDQTWRLPGPWNVVTRFLSTEGGDTYDNVWRKTQAMMKALDVIWQKEGFDFMVMSDTDTFFVMENLRNLLNSQNIRNKQAAGEPIIIGDLHMTPDGHGYVTGGGYVINRKVLEAVDECKQDIKDQVTHADDVMIAACLKLVEDYDVGDEGPACDKHGKDQFEHCSMAAIDLGMVSTNMIMFHHTIGAERYSFYQALYGDHHRRLCADSWGLTDKVEALDQQGVGTRLTSEDLLINVDSDQKLREKNHPRSCYGVSCRAPGSPHVRKHKTLPVGNGAWWKTWLDQI